MPAGKYNLTIEQGTTYRFVVVKKDINKEPVDLTGYTARMQIRPDFADNTATVFASLSTTPTSDGSGITIVPEEGKLIVEISAALTETFNFDTGLYDLELYVADTVERLLEGRVRNSREVTRV
jgi:hypothetical protein